MPLFRHFPSVTARPVIRKRSSPSEDARTQRAGLRLVTKTLLMTILPHPLAAFMLGDFGFSFFLERTHNKRRSEKLRQPPIQPLG